MNKEIKITVSAVEEDTLKYGLRVPWFESQIGTDKIEVLTAIGSPKLLVTVGKRHFSVGMDYIVTEIVAHIQEEENDESGD